MEDRYTQWKTEYETDIKVSLASLAGERMFFSGDSSSGVSGDLQTATQLTALMEGAWGMGEGITSLYIASRHMLAPGDDPTSAVLKEKGRHVEERLNRLYEEVHRLLDRHRDDVLCLADVLAERKTHSGDDVTEILGIPPGIYEGGHGAEGDGKLPLPVFVGEGSPSSDGEQGEESKPS